MKIDRTLEKEIKAAVGDGSREARLALNTRVRAACKDLSTTKVRDTFGETLQRHGRVPVALCVAATLQDRAWRLDSWGLSWALQVMGLWTTHPKNPPLIDDGIHPTAICEYAAEFIRLTTEA